jgi:replication-associated recombination protein RarA
MLPPARRPTTKETLMQRPSKWRPRRFDDIVGRRNRMTVEALQSAARERRPLAAALLGAMGSAKTSTARLLKCSYNCLGPDRDTGDPCWECRNCLRCDLEHNGEWLTYWTYELDGTRKQDRESLTRLLDEAREATPYVPFWLFADEFTRLDAVTAQPVFLKFVEDRGQGVFLLAAMAEEGADVLPPRLHPALYDRLDRYRFVVPEADEQVVLLERLLPTWEMCSDRATLFELVRRVGRSFRQALRYLERAQTLNGGRLDRQLLDQLLPPPPSAALGPNLFADDVE